VGWVTLVRGSFGASDVEEDVKGDASPCRVWRSFKLRTFSIAIAILIVAFFIGILKS
jgi:hypothetical protein